MTISTEIEMLEIELNKLLKIMKWNIKDLISEYFYEIDESQANENEEIRKLYNAFRKAKNRKNGIKYENDLLKYIEFIRNHDDFKKSQYIFTRYNSTDYIDKYTEKLIQKLSKKHTKSIESL